MEIEGIKGLFFSKQVEGYGIKYIYYENKSKSSLTIPRAILEANHFQWNHKDDVFIVFKEIEEKKGFFLYKKVVDT